MTRSRTIVTSLIALTLTAILAACSTAPPPGSLVLSVTGLPVGTAGSIMVTGPGGYAQAVTTTTSLTVASGTYSVSVSEVRGNDAIVPLMYDGVATPTSVTVSAGVATTATVTYAQRPGSGHLWIPMFIGLNEVTGYARGQLAASGSPIQDVSLAGTTNHGEGIAFDGKGNMWVADFLGYLYRYDAASLASSGMPTPAVAINATAYGGLAGLAFDARGYLWTTANTSSQLVGYSPDQLTQDGAPTPAVVITTNGSSLSGPVGIAFDASGNLWVANSTNDAVVQFSAAQLLETGSPASTVTLSSDGANSLVFPYALAFDANGNLWVTNYNSTVVRYSSAQLANTSSPTPTATIDPTSLGATPVGLAFDASGALWVAANNHSGATSEVRRFTNPGAMSGSSTPTASVTITSIGKADAMLIAFSPTPANLPINTP